MCKPCKLPAITLIQFLIFSAKCTVFIVNLTINSDNSFNSINLLKPTGYVMHQQFKLLKSTGHVMHQ